VTLDNNFWDVGAHDIEALKHEMIDLIDYNEVNVIRAPERQLDLLMRGQYQGLSKSIKDYLEWLVMYADEKDIIFMLSEEQLIDMNDNEADMMRYWMEVAHDNGNELLLGSGARYCDSVGQFKNCLDVLESFEYDEKLIINCNKALIESRYIF
jgi:hypothetical protein